MSRHRILVAMGAACLSVSCFTGPSAHSFTPAVTGHGVDGQLQLRNRTVKGELLELRDTAYVLATDEGILLVPFPAVRRAKFESFGSFGGGVPDSEWRERLHLASRFPRGIPESALTTLLAEARQSELLVVRQ
jgi:hypothetical protein